MNFRLKKKERHEPVSSAQDQKRIDSTIRHPYLNARRHWNDHVHSLVRSSLTWQIVATASLLIALGGVAGSVWVAQQSKFVPYVVRVNSLGEAQAGGRADRYDGPTEDMLKATLAAFIENARLVTPDTKLQRKAIFDLYAHISPEDPALMKMNDWLNSNPDRTPFERAAKETVSVSFDYLPLRQTDDTWQVDWVETTTDRQGAPLGRPVMWRAVLSVYVVKPGPATTDEEMLRNPSGIYIRDWNWSKRS